MTDSLAVLRTALDWHREGYPVAVATVLATWGSAPRQPGSRMCVRGDGRFEGSVSGGCVEGAVVQEAEGVLNAGVARALEYGVTNEMAWEVGLACGGRVEILLRPIDERWVSNTERVLAARTAGDALVLVHDLGNDSTRALGPDELRAASDEPWQSAALEALARDRSAVWESDGRRLFFDVFQVPVRVAIVGAVHIAQPLSRMLEAAGFGVVVVDPRAAFATPERFPGVALRVAWPGEALDALRLGPRSAVVTVTHDPKLDDPALRAALSSPAFYVGALGSRRAHAARLERLAEAGFSEEQMERIHAPVGLDIGARTPGEIAASVLAEIIAVLRRVED